MRYFAGLNCLRVAAAFAWGFLPTGACGADAPADFRLGPERYSFDSYGVESGLPGSVVNAAVQTRDGYLWVGTPAGVGRFDGVRFVDFGNAKADGLTIESVQCLYEDRAGALWIGTNRGLVRHRDGKFEHVGLPERVIRSLVEDRGGRLWIGTGGDGLYRMDAGAIVAVVDSAVPRDGWVRALFVDSADRLWIGFERHSGICVFEKNSFRRYDGANPLFGEVLTICETPQGTMWFGTQRHGIFRWRDDALVHFPHPEGGPKPSVTDLRPARDGGLWIAAGALQHAPELEAFAPQAIHGVPNDNVRATHEDREGGLWLCAGAEGLIRMRRMQYRSLSTKEGLPSNNVKTVAEDGAGNLWLAIQHQGITQVAPEGAVKIHDQGDGVPAVEPAVVYVAHDDRVWAGTGSRLYVRGEEWRRFPELRFVRGLFQDSRGAIWIGTENQGLIRAHGEQVTSVKDSAGQLIPFATSFAEAPDGTLYVGTWRKGLYRLRPGEAFSYDRTNGLPVDDVRAIHVDREGNVWAGLAGRGLALFQGGRWLNPDSLAGPLANQVSAIAEDDAGRLWLGTPAGVMWVARRELVDAARGSIGSPAVHIVASSGELRNMPVWSGGQPVVWKARNGNLLFATRRGVIVIDPKTISLNEVKPPVHIERVLVDGNTADRSRPIEIPAGARSLQIEYTALSFVQPGRVLFQHKLDGYDPDWIDAGTRRAAAYGRLPPGPYVFRVRACNNDGVWNQSGSALGVVQLPYFYQTAWFRVLAILGAGGFAYGSYRWSHRRLRFQVEQLERERAMENERRRIAQDLHDDLGASLTEIGLFAESAGNEEAAARPEMKFLGERVRSLVGSLDAIVWAVNPENDSLDHLVAYLGSFFQEFFRRSGIRARLDIPAGIPRLSLSADERSHLFLSAKEAMNNVIKHSRATETWLRVTMNGQDLEMVIEDNGQGFDPSAVADGGNGLTNLHRRLEQLGGRTVIRSAPGRGCCVRIAVSLKKRKEVPTAQID